MENQEEEELQTLMRDHDEDEAERAYYVDGCVVRKEQVYIASKLYSHEGTDIEFTRMCNYKGGEWFYHDLEWEVWSVCCLRGKQVTACALSVQGDVSLITADGLTIEKIPEAGSAGGLGTMRQIQAIEGSLYACGFHGQVYRRQSKRWVHIDEGLLERDIEHSKLYLTGIDGLSETDIYVVGLYGRIHHWDGESWKKVKSPTKAHLERVLCVAPNEVYICGYKGALLRGNARDGFKLVNGEGDNFWGIETYRGQIYLAALSGLFFFDGETVQPLKTGLDPEIKGYRLDAADGVLWSFGVDDLAYFDGKKWTRVIDPDNE